MKPSRVLLATGTAAAGSDDRPRFIQIGIVVALLRLLDPKKFQNINGTILQKQRSSQKTYETVRRRPLGEMTSLMTSSSVADCMSAEGGVEGWACGR